MDRLVEAIKVDVMPFMVISNVADVLLYIEDMRLVTIFGLNNKGCCISYTMT